MPRLSFSLRDVFWLTLVVGMGCLLITLIQPASLPDQPPWARDAIAKDQPSIAMTFATILGGAFAIWLIGYIVDRALGVPTEEKPK
jgi:hypothetical protein